MGRPYLADDPEAEALAEKFGEAIRDEQREASWQEEMDAADKEARW